ncbi:MAG: helix-turn-helix domain-containing protein [Acidobacteriota bacterium]
MTSIVEELVRQGITLSQARREFERRFIEASIRSSGGSLGRAARALGVHRNTLRNKMADLGICLQEVLADERGARGGRSRTESAADSRHNGRSEAPHGATASAQRR